MVKRKGLVLLMTVFFILGCTNLVNFNVLAASDYYVANNGSDSNPGTLSQPWKTIQKACNTVTAGSTVYVRGGTYKEKVTMKTSGTSGVYITFTNYPGENPIIDGTGLSGSDGLVTIEDKNYIIFKGFEICNYKTSTTSVPIGISIEGSGKGIELRNNRVHNIETTNQTTNANGHGIAVYGTNSSSPIDGLIIENNEVYNCKLGQSESVVLNGNVTNFKVNYNKIHDNNNIGIDFIGYEGTASGEVDRARDGECIGNTVYNISSSTNPAYQGEVCADGIYVDGGKNILIDRNSVYNCDIGIEAASEHQGKATDSILIRNNLVYGCKAVAGIAFGGYASNKGMATNIKIINNTLYNNEPHIMIQFNCQYATNIIRNNILYSGTATSGTKTNIVMSNNITSNPSFVNAAGADFQLKTGSTAIDGGIVENYGALDLAGNSRVINGKVDCGAYEYHSSNATPTITPINTATPTNTQKPTSTSTFTPTKISTPTPTVTVTPTPTSTPTMQSFSVSGFISPDFIFSDEVAPILKSGFKVEILGTDYSALTGSDGFFKINGIAPGSSGYVLKISKTSYLCCNLSGVVVTDDAQVGSQTSPVLIWAGDVVQDNAINMSDIMEVSKAFNSSEGEIKYTVNCDLNIDKIINMSDIMIIAKHFNKTPPDYPPFI